MNVAIRCSGGALPLSKAVELRAELHRIYRDSRDRDRLQEIAGALREDGYRLAECLARPLLVEQLARAFYAEDERFGAGTEEQPPFDEWLDSVRPELSPGIRSRKPASRTSSSNSPIQKY